MNISYLLRYLWKKKWLIIIPSIIAIALAWLFTRHLSPEYTSVAELSTGYMDGSPIDNSPKINKAILFNNVIQTLRSNQVLDLVSYQLLLHDLQEKIPFKRTEDKSQLNKIIAQYPEGRSGLIASLRHRMDSSYVLNLAKDNDRVIRKLADMYGYSPDALMKQLQIQRIEGSDFIKIIATTTNPALSATVSNGVCQQFLALYQNKQGKASITSLDTLKKLVETKKQILDNKLKLLGTSNDLSAENSGAILGTLRNQLIQQKSNLIAAKVALQSVNNQIGESDEGKGLTNNGDIIILRNNIDSLYAKYVNEGSPDKELLVKIDRLRGQLQQKLSVIGGGTGTPTSDLLKQRSDLQVKINVATQTMKDLQSKIRVLEGTVQTSFARQGIIQGIQSEIEVARQQYLQANSLYNNTLNHTLFPGNDFKQVLHASPPLYPNPSTKAKIIAFAGVGIFCVLIFLLLFFEFIDPSIKTPAYLKENLPVALLASLKRIDFKSLPVEKIFSVNGALPSYKKGYRDEVKQLRYTLENSGKRIFLIAGYHTGSGRTTIIESLAGSLSLNNRKVLLIDANFHNNTLSRKYNANASLESLDLTSDDLSAEKKMRENMASTSDENIQLIGCGQGDYTPEEVLPRENVFTQIRKNCSEFDYILIDCAALSQGPDCKELLKYVDSVIIIFAADQPLAEGGRKFIDFLKQNRVNTIGTVLNRVHSYSMDI